MYTRCMTKKVQPVSNVLMLAITERAARNVAAMLKRIGYTQIRVEDCRKRSPIEIAAFCEPYNEVERDKLIREIAQAAGLQPRK